MVDSGRQTVIHILRNVFYSVDRGMWGRVALPVPARPTIATNIVSVFVASKLWG